MPSITGHYKEVRDIDWSSDGSFLVSCSKDQTTRVYSAQTKEGMAVWGEQSRAQIHGYDINTVKTLKLEYD